MKSIKYFNNLRVFPRSLDLGNYLHTYFRVIKNTVKNLKTLLMLFCYELYLQNCFKLIKIGPILRRVFKFPWIL